jgi:transposase
MIKEITESELDGLISRLSEAIDNNLSLSLKDMKLLLEILQSYAHLSEQLADNDITLYKLKKLAGLVNSSEKFRTGEKPEKQKSPKEKEEKVVEHKECHHKLVGLAKGDVCPQCGKGKLYKYEPAITVRVSGNSPLVSTRHIREKLRCNACQQYFTAELPKEVVDDGGEENMYGYSARAIMAIYRYFGGLPLHRQESVGNLLGVPVNASTILNQVEKVSDAANPVFNHLKKMSADAMSYQLDDTTNRILDAGKVMLPDRRTGKEKERSGVYTSGLIAETEGKKIVIFNTNIGHAGEFIDEILRNRNANAPPLIMSDASASNRPSVIKAYHLTLCNAHARRQFYDLYNHFPDKVTWVLEKYALIWENEEKCKGNNAEDRLKYRHENSFPVMAEIKAWGEKQLETKEVEENSALGKAINYFINNYKGLSAFCHIPAAKIDNNEMESILKLIIRGRKNSLFFKKQIGADIADVLTSLIATCQKQNVNSFHYLTELQKHSLLVLKTPGAWLPWNYKDSLNEHENENLSPLT